MNKAYFQEIDFTKGVLILLMIIFHVRYLGIFDQEFAHLKSFVYTFHMPGFLVLSGFLTNFKKSGKKFFSDNVRKILIPYLIFEFLYVLALYLAPQFGIQPTNYVNELNTTEMLKYLFLQPTGTYWYLHTLIICNTCYYFCIHIIKKDNINTIILFSIILFIISLFTVVTIPNFIFYILGILLRNHSQQYSKAVKPTILSIILVTLIAYITYPSFERFSLYTIATTYLMLSFFLAIYNKIKRKRFLVYLGKNSYSFVLFSPIFTVSAGKFLQYFTNFDSTGLAYIIFATSITILGSISISYLITKMNLSFLLGMKKFYKKYQSIDFKTT